MRLAVVVLGIAISAGCSAADPGAVTYGPPRDGASAFAGGAKKGESGAQGGTQTGAGTGAGSTSGSTTSPDAGAGSGGGDGGGGAAADSGASAAPPNAFTGAQAYAATAPADQSAKHHGGASNAGLNCLTCHVTGGASTPFTFAGTIYKDAAGTQPAVNAEVRVVTAAGALVATTYSDASGNFWVGDEAKVPAGALTGGRNGPTPKLMVTALTAGTGGACNSCHGKAGGSTAPPIHLQ